MASFDGIRSKAKQCNIGANAAHPDTPKDSAARRKSDKNSDSNQGVADHLVGLVHIYQLLEVNKQLLRR